MPEAATGFGLRVVDARRLPQPMRDALRPDAVLCDRQGRARQLPRYVPCAVTLLAACLEQFRDAVGTYVHVAANGGYRSPRHRLTCHASPHAWGTAVNLYRVGDTFLDTREAIERYAELARAAIPGVWARPYGHGPALADDHLHLDLGYVVAVPRDVPGDTFNPKLDGEPW